MITNLARLQRTYASRVCLKVMAQYTFKRSGYFDSHWSTQIAFGDSFLADVQNRWLLDERSYEEGLVVAVLFRILADYQSLSCSFDQLRDQVDSAMEECRKLLPRRSMADCKTALSCVTHTLRAEVDNWRRGASPADSLALQCAESLAAHSFIILHV